jgi:hypothetical protein
MGQTASTSAQAAGVYGVDSSGSAGSAGSLLPAGVSGSSTTGYGGFFSSRNIASKHVFINSDASQGASVYLADGSNAIEAAGSLVVSGTKSFVDPHPGDPSRTIAYVALEGPEAGTYFRGRGRIHNGVGTIEVPESFRLVSDEQGLTVQVTPIGQAANVAVTSYDLNSVSVKSPVRELEFFYVVNGVRRNFKDFDPMTAAPSFFIPEGPDAQMSSALSEGQRAALIANGTYNPDGTVNLKTAEAAGWTKKWAAKEAEAKALAAAQRKGHEEPAQAKDIGHNLRTN